MPLYDYTCPSCDWKGERFAKMDERDAVTCTNQVPDSGYGGDEPTYYNCGCTLMRTEISGVANIDTRGGYQMKAVLSDGRHMPGHFGRGTIARKGKGTYKP